VSGADRNFAASVWKRVAFVAAAVIFVVAMLACLERGWHAPRPAILVPLFALGILFGVGVSMLRARSLGPAPVDPEDAIIDVTSTRHTTHALAALIGAVTSLVSGVGLGLVMGGWQELVGASVVGSLYMATWPLQVLAANVVLEQRLSIGIDGVRVGRRHFPFRTLRAATTDAKDGSITLHCEDGTVLRHRCASLEMARDLSERIAARLASRSLVDAATTRVARDGRTLDAWRRELLAPDYRESAITQEAATRILHSGAATPDERVGAALILAGRSDGGDDRQRERTRIRLAAAACIDHRLRVALEHVAEDRLDEATLDALEARRAR
jgi:hypothetical protein